MLRIIAILVVGLFTIMWTSGNDLSSVKYKLVNWVDSGGVSSQGSGDWGP